MGSLSDYANSGRNQFESLKDLKRYTFGILTKVPIVGLWTHWVAVCEERQDDPDSPPRKVVFNKRVVCPGISACAICSLKNYLKKHNQQIPDDAIIWDLHENIPNVRTSFTKLHVLGQVKGANWKENFTHAKEVYLGTLDCDTNNVKPIQVTAGFMNSVLELKKNQISQFSSAGDIEINPYALIGEYHPEETNPQKKYIVYKAEKLVLDEAQRNIIFAPHDMNLAAMVDKDYSDYIVSLVQQHLVNISIDSILKRVALIERRVQGNGTDFDTRKLDAENAAVNKPVSQPQPVPQSPPVQQVNTPTEPDKLANLSDKLLPKKEEPAKAEVQPQVTPPAATGDPKLADCLKCGAKNVIDMNKTFQCPKCKQDIFD